LQQNPYAKAPQEKSIQKGYLSAEEQDNERQGNQQMPRCSSNTWNDIQDWQITKGSDIWCNGRRG
jgi:primosomal replication protein N